MSSRVLLVIALLTGSGVAFSPQSQFGSYSRASKSLSASRSSPNGDLFGIRSKKRDNENEKLLTLSRNTLEGSDLIYAFASLRKAVKQAIAEGKRFDRPELILTNLPGVPLTPDEALKKAQSALSSPLKAFDSTVRCNVNRALNRYLKREIPVVDIYDFVISNKEFCTEIPNNVFNYTKVKDILNQYLKLDMGLVEFDDEFQQSELVFGISINRAHKRLTVCFRGSEKGTQDWPTNFKVLHTPLAINLSKLNGSHNGIKVHSGFNGYLNDALKEGDAKTKKYDGLGMQEFFLAAGKEYKVIKDQDFFAGRSTKYDDIVQNIKDLYKTFKDYDLFVCGHSLGGALSQLLAFQLASDGRLDKHANAAYPVKAITFASPCVGNKEFMKAYQKLEKDKLVRHVRISNEGDVVPVLPPVGYTQTGVHVHGLKDHDKPLEVGYGLFKSFNSQVAAGWTFNPFKVTKSFGKSHSLDEHESRLFNPHEENKDTMNSVIEELYKTHAGNYTD